MNKIVNYLYTPPCDENLQWPRICSYLQITLTIICFMLFGNIEVTAQERIISGTVYDEFGPLPQAIVTVKGTQRGVVTDNDGHYSIQAGFNDVLVFSSSLSNHVEIPVDDKNIIDATIEGEWFICTTTVKKRTFFGRVFASIGNLFRQEDVDVKYKYK